jgi:hypothetical protein
MIVVSSVFPFRLVMLVLMRPFFLWTFLLGVLLVAAGCSSVDKNFNPYLVRLYIEESPNLPASHVTDMVLPVSGSRITVRSRPVFGEWDILRARDFDTEFGPAIVLLFTQDAATDLYRTTISNQGRRMVLTINGLAVGSQYIGGPIEDGRISFFMEIDDVEVREVAEGIQRTSTEIQKRANKK